MDYKKRKFRKEIKQFLSDESGFVSRDSLIRAGIRGVAIASLFVEGSQLLSEACSHTSSWPSSEHINVLNGNAAGGRYHTNSTLSHSSFCTY